MNYFLYLALLLICFLGFSQKAEQNPFREKPKLVVGIVVDQMRYDYLTRFYNRFGEGGFKKLIEKGFSCRNHHVNFIPSKTAPGHASVFSGTSPKEHGILGNIWYDRFQKEVIYCVDDNTVDPVGTGSSAGKKSPRQLQVTTLGDQNKLATQMRGKTISISIKDRAAILAGGHTADAAYWYRGKGQGAWISSSYYMQKLPKWVINFNDSGILDTYVKEWTPLYPIATYRASGSDNNVYERGFRAKEKPVFPYDLKKLKEENGNYDIIRQTPFGNSFTVDFAIAAIKAEQLGTDKNTDMLTISFSGTDYIGHNFGVNSIEVEDTYLRLDKDLKRLINALDVLVGTDSYTVFLTSDHGASHVPGYLKSVNLPASYFKEASVRISVKNYVRALYGSDGLIERMSNNQIYLNTTLIEEKRLNEEQIQQEIANYLVKQKGIDKVFTRSDLSNYGYESGTASLLQNGFHLQRSGDVIFTLDPSTVAYARTGSAHGSGFNYDTHVPLLFYGYGIRHGSTTERTEVTDIAPTMAALLRISFPNKNTGTVITKAIE